MSVLEMTKLSKQNASTEWKVLYHDFRLEKVRKTLVTVFLVVSVVAENGRCRPSTPRSLSLLEPFCGCRPYYREDIQHIGAKFH